MRYELKRNKNGMITQCETNADGGNIYAQREEINKVALKNLARPTPGKLGSLSNLQLFNFNIADIETGNSSFIKRTYNTNIAFPGNVVDCVMFGINSLNGKALYYNVLDVKVNVNSVSTADLTIETTTDSFVSFYTLRNNETSTSSLGTKIPQPSPLFGSSSGTITWTTDGNIFGNQLITANVGQDSVNIPSNTKGIRCSGLALSEIFLGFTGVEDRANINLDLYVYVDVSSVSSTY